MASGQYEIPDEYQDEDKWWLFTKKQWGGIIIAAALDYGAYMLLHSVGLDFLAYMAVVAITLIIGILIFYRVPYSYYLYGSGTMLSGIIYRMILRKLKKNRKIYTGSYDPDTETNR